MRIRSTKPEFWRSRRIAAVDWEARFVLKGLESYVDDNGVGKDDIALIVTDVFPRDFTLEPSRVLKRVQVAINTLSEAGLVRRYTVDGTDLLFIMFWEQAQYINRPSKGRFPRPDGTFEYGESEIQADDLSPQEDVLSPQTLNRGTGNRGTGDQERATARRGTRIPDGFEVTDDMRDWASKNGLGHLDLEAVTEEFVDFWRAATKNAVKRDWVATWRNRVREVAKRQPQLRAVNDQRPEGW